MGGAEEEAKPMVTGYHGEAAHFLTRQASGVVRPGRRRAAFAQRHVRSNELFPRRERTGS
jgi:hypothetical protein